jgi:hypothetical protein
MKEVNNKGSFSCFSLRQLSFGFLPLHLLRRFSSLSGGIITSSSGIEKTAKQKGPCYSKGPHCLPGMLAPRAGPRSKAADVRSALSRHRHFEKNEGSDYF